MAMGRRKKRVRREGLWTPPPAGLAGALSATISAVQTSTRLLSASKMMLRNLGVSMACQGRGTGIKSQVSFPNGSPTSSPPKSNKPSFRGSKTMPAAHRPPGCAGSFRWVHVVPLQAHVSLRAEGGPWDLPNNTTWPRLGSYAREGSPRGGELVAGNCCAQGYRSRSRCRSDCLGRRRREQFPSSRGRRSGALLGATGLLVETSVSKF